MWQSGGGIMVDIGARLVVTGGSSISHNVVEYPGSGGNGGGGIYQFGEITLDDCHVHDNRAINFHGGGLYGNQGVLILRGNTCLLYTSPSPRDS